MYLIAEIGFNHEGDMTLAREMIAAAAEAGADAVKFQTFRALDIALYSSPHFAQIKCGEMGWEEHCQLKATAEERGVDFLSTPFSKWGVGLLTRLGVPAFKVASMDCTNKALLEEIARTGKPVYLSTGMANVSEIGETLTFLKEQGSGPVSLLHCLCLYPADAGCLNLETIPFLKSLFRIPVGYSDHYPGTRACLAAALLGADLIETHFTLDKTRQGGDHHHSVEPAELKALVEDVREMEVMRGSKDAIYKRPDRACAQAFRRGVYASRNLEKGHRLKEDDFLFARPTSDFTPNDRVFLLGKEIKKDLAAFHQISREILQP